MGTRWMWKATPSHLNREKWEIEKGKNEQMCRCCLIPPLPPLSRAAACVLMRRQKQEQGQADTGWDGLHPGETASTTPPRCYSSLEILPPHLHCPIPNGDDGSDMMGEFKFPLCLRLICELSLRTASLKITTPVCAFVCPTLSCNWQLKHWIGDVCIYRIWQRVRLLVTFLLNSLERCLGNWGSIRLGAVGRKAWGNHWNSLTLCNQCNAPLWAGQCNQSDEISGKLEWEFCCNNAAVVVGRDRHTHPGRIVALSLLVLQQQRVLSAGDRGGPWSSSCNPGLLLSQSHTCQWCHCTLGLQCSVIQAKAGVISRLKCCWTLFFNIYGF